MLIESPDLRGIDRGVDVNSGFLREILEEYLPVTEACLLDFSRQSFVFIDKRAKTLFDTRRSGFRLECPEACRGPKIFDRMVVSWLIRIFIEIGHVGRGSPFRRPNVDTAGPAPILQRATLVGI